MATKFDEAPVTTSVLPPAAAARTNRFTLPRRARGFVGVAVFLILLEVGPSAGLVDRDYLPTTLDIVKALGGQVASSLFWDAVRQTITGWALGLTVATAAALVIGTLLATVPLAGRLTHSTIEFMRPIPSVALIPVVVLLYGTSTQSTLILVVYATFWPLLIQVMHGVRDVDPVAVDTARSYRLKLRHRLTSVIWPSAFPYFMTGFRLAASVALILEVSGELIVGSPGIGQRIALAQSAGAVPTLYALITVAGALGLVVNIVVRRAEQRTMHWHISVRGSR
jgi:ABC-type nitrate/sulfonate/bicarbonate transport system permease component